MQELMNYIRPELLILVPVLYFLGTGLKKSFFIKDNYIPLILGISGILFSSIWVIGNCPLYTLSDAAIAVFTALVQGIMAAGMSTYVHQLIKQMSKDD